MAKMRAVQVPGPRAAFQIVERNVPEPGAGEVRIRVQACGICHSDALTKEGLWPGLAYPRVPGHEVAGILEVSPRKDDERQGSLPGRPDDRSLTRR